MQKHDFFSRLIQTQSLGPNMAPTKAQEEPDRIYICNACSEEHEDSESAYTCCPPDILYRCNVCRKKYSDEDDAMDCHPKQSVGQPMRCPICLQDAESYEEAADCCLHTHPTMTAAGRQRVAQAVENGTPWPDAVAANLHH